MKVVVLGGTGNFGARICRSLAAEPGFEVVAASRGGTAPTSEGGSIAAVRLDSADPAFPAALLRSAPDLVIHCAGPFQGQDYRVASATIQAGAHYIDLSDARGFVMDFADRMDAAARAAGVLAVSGASSLPALSSAVVDHLSTGFERIEAIETVIAPGQRAQRGSATVAGTLSYAGRPFKLLRDGSWIDAYGWQGLRRLNMPGLGTRWSALCDVPDLGLLPDRYPGVQTVEFRAALELGSQHFGLSLLGRLRRLGLPIPVERLASPLNKVASALDRFGGDVGGMTVTVTGVRPDGARRVAEWHLTVDAVSGPEIPAMPAAILARKLAAGETTRRGATPCVGLLTLEDFSHDFRRWEIASAIEERDA